MKQAELVIDCQNVLGEGVLWDAAASRLHWVDIESSELWTLDPTSGRVLTHRAPERLTCLAPRRVGGFVAAFASGFALYDPATDTREDIAAFEPDRTMTRLNDGRTDRQGRFIAGGFDEKNGAFISSVVRLDPDRRVTKLFDEVACANGICFSPDGRTMYFADSPAKKMWSFDYDPESGAVEQPARTDQVRRSARACPTARASTTPDASGMRNGMAVASFASRRMGGSTKSCRFRCRIRLVSLSAAPSLDTLYITTARYLMTPEQIAAAPHSGALFACIPGVKGLADPAFAG